MASVVLADVRSLGGLALRPRGQWGATLHRPVARRRRARAVRSGAAGSSARARTGRGARPLLRRVERPGQAGPRGSLPGAADGRRAHSSAVAERGSVGALRGGRVHGTAHKDMAGCRAPACARPRGGGTTPGAVPGKRPRGKRPRGSGRPAAEGRAWTQHGTSVGKRLGQLLHLGVLDAVHDELEFATHERAQLIVQVSRVAGAARTVRVGRSPSVRAAVGLRQLFCHSPCSVSEAISVHSRTVGGGHNLLVQGLELG
mmetsp:Transcript_13004/g.38198  ORF Transcript_13004/g.38198 Transcript_13004/m.38198 type:complete len:258 (+) Transcript_13004:350-1123(+)